jgi:hypothetical protein
MPLQRLITLLFSASEDDLSLRMCKTATQYETLCGHSLGRGGADNAGLRVDLAQMNRLQPTIPGKAPLIKIEWGKLSQEVV